MLQKNIANMGSLSFMILLIIAGILFILAEILLVPGVGIAGILGLLSMAGACYYAYTYIGTSAFVIVTSISLAILVAAVAYALRAKTWQRLALETNIESTVADNAPEITVGQRGFSETRLAPMGSARFGGAAVEVKSCAGMIDAGTEVEVALIEDNKIFVKPVKE